MPNKKSGAKALRQDAKKALRNRNVKRNVDNLRKEVRQLVDKDIAKATEATKKAIKAMDRAVSNGVLKKGTVDRYKSRLAKLVKSSSKK
tara:strand:- start:2014 stop:2280 length:267 start_codon:yes stop_codon:yes gene_type:complete